MGTVFWTAVILLSSIQIGSTLNETMKCRYGERGSLTVTCFNAVPGFFKLASYKFDHLDETLQCVNCVLTVLDSGTFDIAGNQIKFLDLKNSSIETIKNRAFAGLIFMDTLDLSHNSIRQITPGTFTSVKKIEKLDLSWNLINVLNDDGFAELENLETLNLQYNMIKMIVSKAFNGVVRLMFLDLSNNLISDISPDVFNNVSYLSYVKLNKNKLTSLKGKEFYNATSLMQLDLSYNQITQPLIELAPGNSLKYLNISYNKLEKLQNGTLVKMPMLETLDLSYNPIANISKNSFENMFNLHALHLAYNNLTRIETAMFTILPQLRFLNCSHNNVQALEVTGVFSLNSLHTLDISYNNITDIDYMLLLSRTPRINQLRMEGNPLSCSLEAEMSAVIDLANIKITLNDNNTHCTGEHTMKTTYLEILKESNQDYNSLSAAEICIVVLLNIVFVAIGLLFFLQYRIFNQTHAHKPRRVTSTVNLISEMEVHDDQA